MKNTLSDNKLTAVRRVVSIKADASGNMPQEIELVPAGQWPNSWKGNLEITIADLYEMKANFDAGMGLPGGGLAGAPIDYSHEDWEKAAAWIKSVEVRADKLVTTSIEWTKRATESIKDGEWKFISPSFYPACMGMWCDPEDPTKTARNVLMGAGLTNIPFFKGLAGIKASQSIDASDEKGDTIYISNQIKGDVSMNLSELRVKPKTDLSEAELAFLKENRSELTAEEEALFGFEAVTIVTEPVVEVVPPVVEPVVAPVVEPVVITETPEAIQASIKAGSHKLMAVADIEALQASIRDNKAIIDTYREKEIKASVESHAARGAIKADQVETWTKKIIADQSIAELLTTIPDNVVLASEIGDSSNTAVKAAAAEITEKAKKLMASNSSLDLGSAISQVRKSEPELANRYDEEQTK